MDPVRNTQGFVKRRRQAAVVDRGRAAQKSRKIGGLLLLGGGGFNCGKFLVGDQALCSMKKNNSGGQEAAP